MAAAGLGNWLARGAGLVVWSRLPRRRRADAATLAQEIRYTPTGHPIAVTFRDTFQATVIRLLLARYIFFWRDLSV